MEKGRHDAGKLLQSLGCRSFPFAKQVNVLRQIDQRVWPLFPAVPSAWKDSGKRLKFIFILSAKFWHLEIKLIWKSHFPIFPRGFDGMMPNLSEELPFHRSVFFCLMSVTLFGSCYFSVHLWYIFLWNCHACNYFCPAPLFFTRNMPNF